MKRGAVGFTVGLDVVQEKKRGVKGNSKVLGPTGWVNGDATYLNGEACGRSRRGMRTESLAWTMGSSVHIK